MRKLSAGSLIFIFIAQLCQKIPNSLLRMPRLKRKNKQGMLEKLEKRMPLGASLGLLLISLGLQTSWGALSLGATKNWIQGFEGQTKNWSDPTNWNGGVPTTNDVAQFGNLTSTTEQGAVGGGQSVGQLLLEESPNWLFSSRILGIQFDANQTIGLSDGQTPMIRMTDMRDASMYILYFPENTTLYGGASVSQQAMMSRVILRLVQESQPSVSIWSSIGNPTIQAILSVSTEEYPNPLKFKNSRTSSETVRLEGVLEGYGNVELETTSSGSLKLILADVNESQSFANYGGAIVVPSNTTLEGSTTGLPTSYPSSITLSGGTLAFTDTSGTVNYASPVTVTGASTITAASGATSVTLGGGTNIMGTGTLSLPSNNTIRFSTDTGAAITINEGGTFDLSPVNITGSSQNIMAGQMSVTSGSIIKVGVNGAYSTVIDVAGTNGFVLTGVIFQIVGTPPSATTEYDLFTNVGATKMSGSPTLTTAFPNMTPTIGALTGSTVKLILTLRSPAPPSIHNGQTVAGGGSVVAGTAQTASIIIGRGVLNVARDGSLDRPSFGSSSFTTHPLKAPDLKGSFLNVTESGIMHASQDNTQRWSPVRTEKAGVWFQPFGRINRQVTNGASPGSHSRTAGLLAGFDYKSRYDIIWGAALGYARTLESFDANAGKTGVKDKFLTVFGTWYRDPWYVEGSLLLGLEKYTGTRNTGPTNNNIFVSNHHGGYQWSPHVGAGYTFEVKGSKVKAYATFNYTAAIQYGYQEQGVGGSYFKQMDSSMLRSEVGANVSKLYEYNGFKWKPGFTLGVVNKKPIKKGTIVSASGASFESTTVTTTSLSPAIESTLHFDDGYALSASWIGEFCSQYSTQEAFLKFTKKF